MAPTKAKRILCLFIIKFCFVIGSYYDHKIKLVKYLLNEERYNPEILPTLKRNESIAISLDVGISDYVEVFESTQTVQVDLWLNLSWTDSLLTWNQSEHGEIEEVNFDVTKIWHPELKINFGADTDAKIFHESFHSIVSNNGTVRVVLLTNSLFRCPLFISKFPFDIQKCPFYIVIENALFTEAFFENSSSNVKGIGTGQWDTLSHEVKNLQVRDISVAEVTINIKRKPGYYILYIMLPIFGTAVLNPIVLLIPRDSGERITTAITVTLSYSVFLSLITGVLPRTSTSTSILSTYIAFGNVLSGIYVLIAVILERKSKYKFGRFSAFCKRNSVNSFTDERTKSVNNDAEHKECVDKKGGEDGTSDWYIAVTAETIVIIMTLSVVCYLLL